MSSLSETSTEFMEEPEAKSAELTLRPLMSTASTDYSLSLLFPLCLPLPSPLILKFFIRHSLNLFLRARLQLMFLKANSTGLSVAFLSWVSSAKLKSSFKYSS